MISESGSVEALLRAPGFPTFGSPLPTSTTPMDHSRLDRLDPMQNQLCRVCDEPAAGFHFGAFTCEGCKSFFGRTCNNQSVIQECKNNYRCVVDKKNRTACKACRLRKCLMVGMSKSGSRYGRRSNWFKIHCLMQQNLQNPAGPGGQSKPQAPPQQMSPPMSSSASNASSLSPTTPPSIGNLWTQIGSHPPAHSPQQRDLLMRTKSPISPTPEARIKSASPASRASPEDISSPTMVPHRPSPLRATPPSLSHPAAPASLPESPFKSLIPPLAPLITSSAAPPTLTTSVPAAPAIPNPMASLYGGFPSPAALSLFSGAASMPAAPAFPGIPLHKQALLSPLLAQSHLWQLAAARSHPLFGGLPGQAKPAEPLDIFAEHKALMEKFSSQMSAMAAASAAMESAEKDKKESLEDQHKALMEKIALAAKEKQVKEDEDNNEKKAFKPVDHHVPMDLSKRESEDSKEEEDDEDIEVKVEDEEDSKVELENLKSDLNRNIVQSSSEATDKVLDLCKK